MSYWGSGFGGRYGVDDAPFTEAPRASPSKKSDVLDGVLFRPDELEALSKRPVFKALYMATAILIVMGSLTMIVLGLSLWGDEKLDDKDVDATNTLIMLSFMALPVGYLFYMLLQNIRDGMGLFGIVFGFVAYCALYSVRLNRAM